MFAKQSKLFLDIGANIGYYSILLSDINELNIISVEPDESNRKILEKNISLNNIKNITVISDGISSNSGFVTFYIDQNTGRTSSIHAEAWHPAAVNIIEAKIKIITLNELIEKYGSPDLIKCDVEGHELEVLKGADKALTSKTTWFIETTKENFSETLSVFYKYGYVIFNSESPEYKMINDKDQFVPNLLCIHKSELNDFSSNINIQ
jgi:FkbM family methyltransferase